MEALGPALALLAAYLMGSFPTSILVGRLFFGKDPRDFGSGNAGGTNSFRVFGWKAGLLVSAVDLGKGAAAILLAPAIAALAGGGPAEGAAWAELLRVGAALAAVAGHVWTLFAGFRGGKGVATGAGALFALAPLPTAIAALAFALSLLTTGIVSLSSIGAALALALASSALALAGLEAAPSLPVLVLVWILLPLILFTHRANIARLRRGEEASFERLRVLKRWFGGSRRV